MINIKRKEWHSKVDELLAAGEKSGRTIAKMLGRGKSQVNEYISSLKRSENDSEALSQPKGAKVLFLDLEVSASIVAAFSMFKHFSSPDHIIQFPYVLTYAANWLHDPEDKIECFGLDDFDTFTKDHRDDFELILRLWNLIDSADIVVAQNAPFDTGWFNQRCAYHNLPEPSPYRVVDTLKGMKKSMSLPSNSLGYTTKYFNLPHTKLHNEGISLWIRCMDGDKEALSLMKSYNVGDIPTLRELYLKIRAFIPNHPNIALYFGETDQMRCPTCGGTHLDLLEGKAYTNLSVFDAYRCKDCGTVKRSGTSATTSAERKLLLRQVSK